MVRIFVRVLRTDRDFKLIIADQCFGRDGHVERGLRNHTGRSLVSGAAPRPRLCQ